MLKGWTYRLQIKRALLAIFIALSVVSNSFEAAACPDDRAEANGLKASVGVETAQNGIEVEPKAPADPERRPDFTRPAACATGYCTPVPAVAPGADDDFVPMVELSSSISHGVSVDPGSLGPQRIERPPRV